MIYRIACRRYRPRDIQSSVAWSLGGLLIVVGLPALQCCSLAWPSLLVRMTMPELPAVWVGARLWHVDWQTRGWASHDCAAPGETLLLKLPRTTMAAIRCWPVFAEGYGRPYGALWPAEATKGPDGMVLLPDAAGGLSAELAVRLYRAGLDPAGFDLPRFGREAEQRMSDPWSVDLSMLASALAQGRFRSDYFRNLPTYPVEVHGLGGLMAPDSPWASALLPDLLGVAQLSMAPGVRRWFGNGQELVVSVSADGAAVWLIRNGTVIENSLP